MTSVRRSNQLFYSVMAIFSLLCLAGVFFLLAMGDGLVGASSGFRW